MVLLTLATSSEGGEGAGGNRGLVKSCSELQPPVSLHYSLVTHVPYIHFLTVYPLFHGQMFLPHFLFCCAVNLSYNW